MFLYHIFYFYIITYVLFQYQVVYFADMIKLLIQKKDIKFLLILVS
jgi:hypothetical protein